MTGGKTEKLPERFRRVRGKEAGIAVLVLVFLACLGALAFAADKELKAIKIGSFADKTRVVLHLSGEGFFEVRHDAAAGNVAVSLYGFANRRVPSRQKVDERLISAVTVRDEGDRLVVVVELRHPLLDYHAELFGSPPLLVVDLFPGAVENPAGEPSAAVSETGFAAPLASPGAAADAAAAVDEAIEPPAAPSLPAAASETNNADMKKPLTGSAAVDELAPEQRLAAAVPAAEPAPQGSLGTLADVGGRSNGVYPLPAPEYRSSDVRSPVAGPAAATSLSEPADGAAALGLAASETTAAPKARQAAADIPKPGGAAGAAAVPSTPATVVPLLPADTDTAAAGTVVSLPPPPAPVTGTATATVAAEKNATAAALYEEGLRHYHEGAFAAAVDLFTRMIREFPASPLVPGARFRISDVRARQAAAAGSPAVHRAIDDYLAVIRRYPDHEDAPWAWLQVGRLYESLGFSYEADGAYEVVLRQYPHTEFAVAARLRAARLNYELERWDRAAELFAGLRDDSTAGSAFQPEAWYYEANSRCQQERYKRALKLYEAALKRFPAYPLQDPATLYLIGTCYQQLGDGPRAREYLLMMRNLFPEHRLTNLALTRVGDSLIADGKLVQGLAVLATVIREYPETDGALLARLSMARLGEQEKLDLSALDREAYKEFLDSGACYRQVIEQGGEDNPLTHIARLRLAQLYYRRREYAAARRQLDLLFEADSDPQLRAVALETMRDVLHDELEARYLAGDYAALIALKDRYGRTFLPRPDRLYPYLWVADAMRRQGLYQGALELYVSLAGCDPDYPRQLEIGWGMAYCHLKLGDPAAADAVLAPLFPGPFPAPWDYRLPLLRADVLAARGDREAALELLTGLLERQPKKALDRRAALLIRIGMWQQEGGRPAAAISALKKAAALVTDDPTVVSRGQRAVLAASLGRLYYTTGAYAQSLRWFQDAALLEEHPSTVAELLYWQGAVLARLGRLDEFDRLLATMRKAFPQSHWTTMAANLLQEQRWQEENRQ